MRKRCVWSLFDFFILLLLLLSLLIKKKIDRVFQTPLRICTYPWIGFAVWLRKGHISERAFPCKTLRSSRSPPASWLQFCFHYAFLMKVSLFFQSDAARVPSTFSLLSSPFPFNFSILCSDDHTVKVCVHYWEFVLYKAFCITRLYRVILTVTASSVALPISSVSSLEV